MTSFHRRIRLTILVVAAIVIVVPLVLGTISIQSYVSASHLNVFVVYAVSPISLIAPLLAAWAGNARLFAELGDRQLSNIATRTSLNNTMQARLWLSFLIPAAIFTVSIVLICTVCFGVWPLIGDPGIDPTINLAESAEEVAQADAAMMGFSQLMAVSPFAFSAVYALWTGFAAGIYGALSSAIMLLTGNRIIGLVAPLGLYLVETIIAALTVGPFAGLLYSFSPAGLQQPAPIVTMGPTLIVAAGVVLAWRWLLRHPLSSPAIR